MYGRTRIKMCGITRKKDAVAGIEAGLDALGFIFYEKSPRNVTSDFVRKVVADVPPFIDCVGVFVDRDRKEVEEIVEYCGLSHAQLHGKEKPKYCERLERFASPCRVIKAFRVGKKAAVLSLAPMTMWFAGIFSTPMSKITQEGLGKHLTGMSFKVSIFNALSFWLVG